MTKADKALTVVLLAVVALMAFAMGYYVHPQVRAEGKMIGIGHAMRYVDVPVGHYSVVAVVDRYQPYTAVIRADSYPTHAHQEYLLVTDMMPNMMVERFTFTVGGNVPERSEP